MCSPVPTLTSLGVVPSFVGHKFVSVSKFVSEGPCEEKAHHGNYVDDVGDSADGEREEDYVIASFRRTSAFSSDFCCFSLFCVVSCLCSSVVVVVVWLAATVVVVKTRAFRTLAVRCPETIVISHLLRWLLSLFLLLECSQ